MSIIDNFDILVLCFKIPTSVIPIQQVIQMWSLALSGYKDKIILTSWHEDFAEITKLPGGYEDATILTISKEIYAHLNSLGIKSELVGHMKGYHSTFLRKAYREGIALDWIQSHYGLQR